MADLFKGLFGSKKPEPEQTAAYEPSIVAGVLVAAAQVDNHYPQAEKTLIDRALGLEFRLPPDAATALRNRAEHATSSIGDAQDFRKMGRQLSPDNKIALVEALWRAVLVDHEKDYWENAFMRRTCKFLEVSDGDSKRALKRVERIMRRGKKR